MVSELLVRIQHLLAIFGFCFSTFSEIMDISANIHIVVRPRQWYWSAILCHHQLGEEECYVPAAMWWLLQIDTGLQSAWSLCFQWSVQ